MGLFTFKTPDFPFLSDFITLPLLSINAETPLFVDLATNNPSSTALNFA